MKKIKIFHNAQCKKSRCALEWLKYQQYKFEVHEYMKSVPSTEEFKVVLNQLNCKPQDILRTSEKEYKDLVKGNYQNEEELILLMLRFPKLIERPIVVWEGGGVLARPLEKLVEKLVGSPEDIH